MFLSDSTTCLTGIALKRSHFSNNSKFLEVIRFADQYHNFLFLDYEGINHLLNPTQLETIIKQIRHHLVFTIAVRGCEFHFQRKFLLENYEVSNTLNGNIPPSAQNRQIFDIV